MERFDDLCPKPIALPFYWDLALVYTFLQDSDPRSREALAELWQKKLVEGQSPSVLYRDRITRALRR